MKVFHFDHGGHYIGGLSVVIAETQEQAEQLLADALREHKLDPNTIRLHRVLRTDVPIAYVLSDGDY